MFLFWQIYLHISRWTCCEYLSEVFSSFFRLWLKESVENIETHKRCLHCWNSIENRRARPKSLLIYAFGNLNIRCQWLITPYIYDIDLSQEPLSYKDFQLFLHHILPLYGHVDQAGRLACVLFHHNKILPHISTMSLRITRHLKMKN
jgi:hypothetical protein